MGTWNKDQITSARRSLYRAYTMLQGIPNYWIAYSDMTNEAEETAVMKAALELTESALKVLREQIASREPKAQAPPKTDKQAKV